MDEAIESNGWVAKRKSTGSKISFNNEPFGYPEHAFLYENDSVGVSVRFSGLYVDKKLSLLNKIVGRFVEQTICVGIVLARGELKAEIERKLGSSASVEDTTRDVYELLLELFRKSRSRQFYDVSESEAPIYIYECEACKFWAEIDSGRADKNFGTEAIATLPAALVL